MNWENPEEVIKALLLLYSLQTEDEQERFTTRHSNNVGFNSTDATFLSSVAHQLTVRKRGISEKQFEHVKRLLKKYHRQIDLFNLEEVKLPPTAVIYNRSEEIEKESSGLLYVEGNHLFFKPYIYPTSVVKQFRFRWVDKVWIGPLNLETLEAVKGEFPNVQLDPSVQEWENRILKVIPWKPSKNGKNLFAFQQEAISFALTKRRALLGLSPGLGKSAIALMAAEEAGGKTLIISPLSLVRNWRNELKKWIGENCEIWHQGIGADNNWIVTNYETVLGYMVDYDIKTIKRKGKTIEQKVNWRPTLSFGFDNVIVDESILIKNRKAQRTRAVKAISAKAKNVWMLSGSPVSRFLDDLWSQLNILYPRRFGSYWRFTETYCVIQKTHWGWSIVGNRPDASTQLKRDLRDIYFARTQKQVLNIPDWIFDTFEVAMELKQYQLYRAMEEEFLAELPDGDVLLAPNILTQMLRLIQLASNPVLVGGPDIGAKWSALMELLNFVEFPVIVWTNFIETARHLHSRLEKKYSVDFLTGQVKATERQSVVDRFQQGDLDILIAHPAAGKFGHTLTRGRTAIYVERSYNGDDYYQSLHRVKRIGTEQSPHIIHLLAVRPNGGKATIDRVIHRILTARKNNSIALTSGEIREYFDETIS